MSQENPFKKSGASSAGEEVAENATHFEQAQESGLTDAQLKEIESIEKEFVLLSSNLESLKEKIARVKMLPEGSDERAQAAYALREEVSDAPWKYDAIKPVTLWDDAQGDLVRQALMEQPRFVALGTTFSSLQEKSQSLMDEAKGMYDIAAAARDEQKGN